MILEIKNKIAAEIKKAAQSLIDEKIFSALGDLPEVGLEVPPKKDFGDFATNFAMQSAKIFHAAPKKIAEEIKSKINANFIDKIEIAGAGFMNFYLKSDVIYQELKNIFDAGENFGQLPAKNNQTIQIEYVSAYFACGRLQRRERILH